MTVNPDEYMPKTVEYCHFQNRFVVRILETDQIWTGEDNFTLEKPKLDVRIMPDPPRSFRPAKIYVRFVNPLDHELSKCLFNLEAPGINFPSGDKYRFPNIKAKEKVDLEVEVMPTRSGHTTIVVTFNANELYNVTGTRKISIIN